MENKPTDTPKVKRRNVNPYGAIVTSDEQYEIIYDQVMLKQKKTAKIKENETNKAVILEESIESETEEEIIESSDSDDNEETECFFKVEFPSSLQQLKPYVRECWDRFSPPVPESDLVKSWFAAVFYTSGRKKGTLYIGRVTRRFLVDENAAVDGLELDCLKPAPGPSATILEEPPEHLGKDLGFFKGHDIIAVPLFITYCEGRKWKYADYRNMYIYFQALEKSKVDRCEMFNRIYSCISK